MNGRLAQVEALLQALQLEFNFPQSSSREFIVLPPAIYLGLTKSYLNNTSLHWGGQNIYPAEKGAYTGEHSPPMLKDFSCRYVLVGHSERRQIFCESENFIAEKFHLIKDHDMIPILCIGETGEERLQGKTSDVLLGQLRHYLDSKKDCFKRAVIAYEPVWAIGTGQTPLPEEVQEVHAFIRDQIRLIDKAGADEVPILYGGSVTEKNAASLFAMPDVDGGLVGGASLNVRQFVEICQCIN